MKKILSLVIVGLMIATVVLSFTPVTTAAHYLIYPISPPWEGEVNENIHFEAVVSSSHDYPPYQWSWTFDHTGAGPTLYKTVTTYDIDERCSFLKSFSVLGEYKVTIVCTNAQGWSVRWPMMSPCYDDLVTITAPPLQADAGGPYYAASPTPPQEICFTGSASGGSGSPGDYEYEWDFGDEQTSDERNPCHIYESQYKFPVRLTVTDPVTNIHAIDDTYAYVGNVVNVDALQIEAEFATYPWNVDEVEFDTDIWISDEGCGQVAVTWQVDIYCWLHWPGAPPAYPNVDSGTITLCVSGGQVSIDPEPEWHAPTQGSWKAQLTLSWTDLEDEPKTEISEESSKFTVGNGGGFIPLPPP